MTLIYLIFATILTQDSLKNVYEFFLFKGDLKTHRFKERIYPKKYSFFKRFFLLTYFDKELFEKFKYKKQMKTVVVADRVYLICSLLLIILRIYALISGKSLDDFNVSEAIFFLSSAIFGLWVLVKSIDWKKWIKGELVVGEREFKIHLPDEKKKKK